MSEFPIYLLLEVMLRWDMFNIPPSSSGDGDGGDAPDATKFSLDDTKEVGGISCNVCWFCIIHGRFLLT